MTTEQLNTMFRTHSRTSADFIRWAAGLGVTVDDATVSRHRAGTQGITKPWQIAYVCFFNS